MAENKVVGRDAGKTGNPLAPPKVSPETLKATRSMLDRINKRLENKGLTVDPESLAGMTLVDTLTPQQLTQIGLLLKKRGKSVGASKGDIQRMLNTDPTLTVLVANSTNFGELLDNMIVDYLPGLDTTASAAAPNYPSRNIYKYSDDDVNALINTVYKEKVMRPATEKELAKLRKTVRPQLEQGTLSTTKDVRNKKTGKMETVTTQQGGMTKDAIGEDIGSQLNKLNPDEVDRTARINFSSWLTQNVQGA